MKIDKKYGHIHISIIYLKHSAESVQVNRLINFIFGEA